MSPIEGRHFRGQDKAKIPRLHRMAGNLVSDPYEQPRIHRRPFCHWRRTSSENGARAFEGAGNARRQGQRGEAGDGLESAAGAQA
jgi:hypothetical protein